MAATEWAPSVQEFGIAAAAGLDIDFSPRNITKSSSLSVAIGPTHSFNKHFQQEIDNHGHAVALCFVYYDFSHVHQTLRVTQTMEARLSDHVWSIEEIVLLLK